jgi:hypothetical protein
MIHSCAAYVLLLTSAVACPVLGQNANLAPRAPRLTDLSGFEVENLGPYTGDLFSAVISADRMHLALAAHEGSHQAVFLDGVRQTVCDELLPLDPNSASYYIPDVLRFTADGSRLFYVARRGPDTSVMVNGKEEDKVEQVLRFAIAPVGNGHAYLAKSRLSNHQGLVIVCNGVPSQPFKQNFGLIMRFSPDGQRFGYAMGDERGGYSVVVDGKALGYALQKPLGHEDLQFSLDSKHFAASAASDRKEMVILDGKPGLEYVSVQSICLSADGSHLAFIGTRLATESEYEAGNGGTTAPKEVRAQYPGLHSVERAVLDGKELDGYHATDLVLHPLSGRYAYVDHPSVPWSNNHLGQAVWADGRRGPEYDECRHLVFSPDGKRLAYVAFKDARYYLVVDDEEFGPFEDLDADSFQFSANGAHFGFKAGQRMIVDGAQLNGLSSASSLTFSPDGNRYAYLAVDAAHQPVRNQLVNQLVLVVDGHKTPLPGQPARQDHLTFSPDSRRLAVVIVSNATGAETAVVDNAVIPPFQNQRSIDSLEFSRDSQHFLFTATVLDPPQGGGSNALKQVRVVDGKPGPLLGLDFGVRGGPSVFSPTVFSSQGELSYLARDGDQLIRLRLTSTNLNALPSINDLIARAQQAAKAQARALAEAQARAEAERKARNPLQLLREADVQSDVLALVVQGPDGDLYGSCVTGRFTTGTLFRMHTDGTQFQVLHRFEGPEEGQVVRSLIVAQDGTLYGTTEPRNFSNNLQNQPGIKRVKASLFCCAAGTHEYSLLYAAYERTDQWKDVLSKPLISVAMPDGTLYGKCNPEMVFRFSTKQRSLDVILDGTNSYSSIFKKEGAQTLITPKGDGTLNPKSGQILGDQLLQVGDRLLSATPNGGRANQGQIVSIGLDGEGYQTVYDFSQQGAEGCIPLPRLVSVPGGLVYGVCTEGGDQIGQTGSIFALDPANGSCRPLFRCHFGSQANDVFAYDGHGSIYFWSSAPALYRVRDDGGGEKEITKFEGNCSNLQPNSLLVGNDGKIYGTVGSCVFSYRIAAADAPSDGETGRQVMQLQQGAPPQSSATGNSDQAQSPADPDQVQAPRRTLHPTSEEGSPVGPQGSGDDRGPVEPQPSSAPEPVAPLLRPAGPSQNGQSANRGGIQDDPRYAPLDAKLNSVYSALRNRISPGRKDVLKRMEIAFLRRRESFEKDPNAYFAFTEQQIAILERMLNEAQ